VKILKYFLLLVALTFIVSSGCKDDPTEPVTEIPDTIIDKKPNLYLYPTEKMNISVTLSFPLGGNLLQSIPDYGNGWNVLVDPSGVINDEYGYLFYEYSIPNYNQMEKGWIIAKANLKEFFTNNMTDAGFNETEIKDFTDYWIPRLIDFQYYEIYPQNNNVLNRMTKIDILPTPDNLYRLQYLIKGRGDNKLNLPEPIIEKGKREGFCAFEWGVLLK